MEVNENIKSVGAWVGGIKDKAIADIASLNCIGFLFIFFASCLFPFLAIAQLYWVLGLMYAAGGSILIVGIVIGARRAAAAEKALKEHRAKEAAREAKRVAAGH